MKTLAVIVGALQLAAACVWANGGENFPFHVGEKLTYQIFWGPFVVGRATLQVTGIEQIDGEDCYHLVARAKTSGLAELLFPVDSVSESWFDTDEFCTRRYRQTRSEGGRHWDDETFFDYQNKLCTTTNLLKGVSKHVALDQPVQDVVSAVYFVRSRPLKLHEPQKLVVNANNENFKVTFEPDQRKSFWVRPVGDVQALRIEPNPTLKIVAANNGRLWIWVTDDARRLPLLVASDLKFGTAKLVLFKIESANPTLDKVIRKQTDAARN